MNKLRTRFGDWVAQLGRLPVEAVPAGVFAALAAFAEGPSKPGATVAAFLFAVLMLRTSAGARLLVAFIATALFGAAVLYEDQALARFVDIAGAPWVLAAAGLAWILFARLFGVVVWPDVAMIFLVGLAVVAIVNARDERPSPPEPPRPAIAALDLPAELIRPPANEFRAPTNVEVIALTPKPSPRGAATTHEATRFDALLLTPVERSGARRGVRVLVERGADGATVKALARARIDASEFVLLPAGDCFVAPPREDLAPFRARALLETYGYSEEEARRFVASFEGSIDFVPLHPGREFQRYHSGTRVGRFLTETVYTTRTAAQKGLALPKENAAEERQRVTVLAPTMALAGGIRDGLGAAEQFFVLRPSCLEYPTSGEELD